MILKILNKDLPAKYGRGYRKHGGNLWEKDCLKEALEEAIDLLVYLTAELMKRK